MKINPFFGMAIQAGTTAVLMAFGYKPSPWQQAIVALLLLATSIAMEAITGVSP